MAEVVDDLQITQETRGGFFCCCCMNQLPVVGSVGRKERSSGEGNYVQPPIKRNHKRLRRLKLHGTSTKTEVSVIQSLLFFFFAQSLHKKVLHRFRPTKLVMSVRI